jgi:hypothetical protein
MSYDVGIKINSPSNPSRRYWPVSIKNNSEPVCFACDLVECIDQAYAFAHLQMLVSGIMVSFIETVMMSVVSNV